MQEKTLAAQLGEFTSCLRFENLPAEVVVSAKERFLDFLGSAIWGANRGWYGTIYATPLYQALAELGGRSESTIIGNKRKLPSLMAAFVNSSLALPFSDTCRFSGSHPGTIIVPVCLALGERHHCNGRDFITAMVAGYEILLRIGRAIFPSDVVRGFHPTSIVGPLGSAAAASHLLRLDACKTTHALALAASFSGGLMEAFGAYSTAMIQVGRAAHSGIMAALLAKREIISTDSMLEGGSFTQSGFLSAYTDNFNTEIITRDLGKMWTIRDVALKTYDGVAAVHTGVDAALEIIVKHNLNRDDIEAIDVRTHSRALSLQPSNVETGVQGKFSIPFIIAAYLKDGIISPLTFTDDKFVIKAFVS